jgi:hypothetical protein
MSDLLHQNFATVQSDKQPHPNTVVGAATIVPNTFITFVSGTGDVGTITPPVTGQHMLVLIFTDGSPGDLLTTGNILVGSTTIADDSPVLLFYDPNQAKYYPMFGG